MKEVKLAGIDFSSDLTSNRDPYVIALFAEENCGKTRLAMTGPEVIGCVPLEMKAYVTIDKDSQEFGKRVLKPKDPMMLMAPKRRLDAMKENVDKQRFYKTHIEQIKQVVYALLENKDVSMVMIDKFTTFCVWQEYAINGLTPNYVKIDGQIKQSKSEVRQSLIDFVNSLSQFGKPVVLNCASKADYSVVDDKGDPLRNTWDAGCFYMLGSHANLVCELETNPHWNPKKQGEKFGWHYALNVRRCQRNPVLEGPEGQLLLRDDMIGLPQLMQYVDPELDVSGWL